MKKNVFIMILVCITSFCLMTLLLAFIWRIVAFKYIFQFLTSLGFLITGFYYFLRANVRANISKGMMFVALSPVAFFLSELLFLGTFPSAGMTGPRLGAVLSAPLYRLGPGIKVWHLLIISLVFANAIAAARRPRPNVFFAANILAIVFALFVYLMFR